MVHPDVDWTDEEFARLDDMPEAQPVAAQAEPVAEASTIFDPLTGDNIAVKDIDGLIDAIERIKECESDIRIAKQKIADALVAMTDSAAKTRRVEGKRRRACIKMPDDKWDQGILKEAYNAYPQHRDRVLKIGTVNVQLREWKKFAETTGADDLVAFRDMVKAANRGPDGGMPYITIEQ